MKAPIFSRSKPKKMTVLIANKNKSIITQILPKVKFYESTVNTCTFSCTTKTFERLYSEAKLLGYNPYALMSW